VLAQLPVGLSTRVRAVQECRRAWGGTAHPPWTLLLSPWELPRGVLKPASLEKLPWSFDNQSWQGRDFRQGGIGAFLYTEIK